MKRLGWVFVVLLIVIAVLLAAVIISAMLGSSPNDKPTAVATATKLTTAARATETDTTPPVGSTETVILLYTNDFHGAVEPDVATGRGGLVNLVSLINHLRAGAPDRTLLVDAGDTLQGTYVSNSTQGQVVIAAMNIAGYDAWALGNHEFDWGQEVLRQRIAQAAFPALAANVFEAREIWDAIVPYTIVQAGQAKIAILGLSYPNTPDINKPQNVAGLDFRGPEETARHYLPELQAQADLTVILSHLGYDGDVALARALDGIDVIVGGHSHVFLERPKVANGTIIVQAGAKGQVLGRLELSVDLATGDVVDYSSRNLLQPVTDASVGVNQEVKSLVDAALAEAAETMNQPIGETAVALKQQRAGEFALGNLVVDAMLAADIDGRPADIAMHNNGGIRAALPQGPITYGQLYAVLPFDNQLMALDLRGAQVLHILEHSVAARAGAMQVAGMRFRFSMSEPVGQRVLEATVGGKPLDPERIYRVVTIDYLASGGDGYDTFLEGIDPAYGDTEVWVVAEYIRTHSPIDPRVEGRIMGQ